MLRNGLISLIIAERLASAFDYYPFFGPSWNITEWFWQSAVVAGDYLYIEGGEFYNRPDASDANVEFHMLGGNHQIDLTQDWKNNTVTAIYVEDNPMQAARRPMLWWDSANNQIHKYGGWPYNDSTTYPQSLFTLFVDDNGDASGNTFYSASDPSTNGLGPSSLAPAGAAYASTNSTFYAFDGTSPYDIGHPPSNFGITNNVQGLLRYDMGSMTWANLSSIGSPRIQAAGAYVPQFGSGFLVFVGGQIPGSTSAYDSLADMADITLYDTATGKWYQQQATGDIPPSRTAFCSASVSSGTTFELFIYGGATDRNKDIANPSDSGFLYVYTLTIPAFRWFRSDSITSVRRASHCCTVIGRRQMVSIGGYQPSDTGDLGQALDPWANGIGVFDMTAFEWASQYTANAAEYESPSVVKDYYSSSYTRPVWAEATLGDIFRYESTANYSSGSKGGGGGGGGNDTGAIAGGVVGGVVGAALIAGTAFWLFRSKRLQKHWKQQDDKLGRLPPYEEPHQLHGKDMSPVSELPSGMQSPVELDAARSEIQSRFSELEGTRAGESTP